MVNLVSEQRPDERRRAFPLTERALFGMLLVTAAVVRFTSAGILEPNVSTVEAHHLATVEALLVDRGPSPFGGTATGATGLALLVPAIFRLLRPEPELALRLYAALGSLALVGLFYGLCRSRYGLLPSVAATALLAFAPWSIYFGRNGELNVFVAVWLVAAAWAVHHAARSGGPRRWLLAGAASTLGLYWHPSAIWTLPALLVPLIWETVEHPEARARLVSGLLLFVVAAIVVALPRLPDVVEGRAATAAVAEAPAGQPAPNGGRRARLQDTIRAFFLLDPTVVGDPRYQPTGRAPLDGLTGLLLLGGLALAIWRASARLLPLSLFLLPLLGSQLAADRAPSLGAAVVALPGLYLLVAEALAWAIGTLPFPSMTRAVMLVAVPAYALTGWHAYTDWIGTAASAQARQPALDYDEVDAWLAQQRERLLAGQPVAAVRQWRDEHPRLTTGARTVRRSRASGAAASTVSLSQLELREIATVAGATGARAPRGVALAPSGEVLVADTNGQVSRLDEPASSLVALPRQPPPLEQVSDLAVDAAGFIYLADAERSLLVKLDPRGSLNAVLAGDWGMYRPRGLTIGPDGNLYVADTGRNRVVVGTTDGRLLKSISPPTSAGPLEQPTDVAVDQSGRVYVTLPELGRVAVLDEAGQPLGGWPIPKGNTIDSPRVAVVADGAVAVTDPVQRQVRLYDADGRELAVEDVPEPPYGAAAGGGRLVVSLPPGGRLVVFSLGLP